MSQQTLDRYQHRIAEFYAWAKLHNKKITDDNLDSRVVDYITWVAEHDDPSDTSRGAYLIYGLQLLRCKVAKSLFLPCAKEALASWKRHFPGSMQLPVPEEIIFDLAVSIGNSRLDVALLMLLQFDACLRPSEALQLCKAHVVPPVGGRYNKWAIIVKLSEMKERTKTGTADDSVVVGDLKDRSYMGGVMSFLYSQPGDALFPDVSLAQYERLLSSACVEMGYSAVIVQPHILRHSAASNDFFFKRRDLREVQKRGRWQARKSVSRYEKSGLMQRQWKHAPKHRMKEIQNSKKRLVLFLRTRLGSR